MPSSRLANNVAFPSDAELQGLLQATTSPGRRTRINKCS